MPPLTLEHREARRKGLGASDAATALGRNPWKKPFVLWLEKTGRLLDDDPGDDPVHGRDPGYWGHRLEPLICEEYATRTGRTVLSAPALIRHSEHEWMLASLDRVIQDDGRLLEAKAPGLRQAAEWGEAGSDDIPDYYMLQVQHQLAVADRKVCDVAALIGGQDFRIYTIERNQNLIDIMVAREKAFWRFVVEMTPPPIDYEDHDTRRALAAMYGVTDAEIELGDEADRLATQQKEYAGKIATIKEARDACRSRLMHLMKDAGSARLPSGRIVTRKEVHRAAYSVSATSYTELRVKEPKKEKS